MDVGALLHELAKITSLHWWLANTVSILNIIVIDLVLAGDNAIVVGIAASRVEPGMRNRVIAWGIAAAVLLRIVFAGITTELLLVIGLTFAGGLLLLWVSWKMYRQLIATAPPADDAARPGAPGTSPGRMTFTAAVGQIALADVSMSLDNVLAVAGAAKGSPLVLAVGLGVAVVLMALASRLVAELLGRYPWITWIGLAIIVWVALDMIYRGSHEITCAAIQVGCSETLLEAILHRAGMLPGLAR